MIPEDTSGGAGVGTLDFEEGERYARRDAGLGHPGRHVNKALLILAAACLFVLDSLAPCGPVGQHCIGIRGPRR